MYPPQGLVVGNEVLRLCRSRPGLRDYGSNPRLGIAPGDLSASPTYSAIADYFESDRKSIRPSWWAKGGSA